MRKPERGAIHSKTLSVKQEGASVLQKRKNLKALSHSPSAISAHFGMRSPLRNASVDADSLMSGLTIVRLVHAIETNPTVGLVQTLPMIVNARNLFSRVQQFAAGYTDR